MASDSLVKFPSGGPGSKRKAKRAMRQARKLSRQSGQTAHVYSEADYAAQSWPHERRIIIKAEIVRAEDKLPKDNPRFVITNLHQSPQWIYEQVYCQRGESENRIKELHDLQIDRTSCSGFWANQFRVLLTAAAYVLMQELRLRAAHTRCARAQVGTLREQLLKLGARVLVSVRRVVVHLPASFPFLPIFQQVALALDAAPLGGHFKTGHMWPSQNRPYELYPDRVVLLRLPTSGKLT